MLAKQTAHRLHRNHNDGFSTLELMIVVAIVLIATTFAIPGYNAIARSLRIAGDGRDLNGAINQAKMQAASGFTHARVYLDIGANTPNTFHVDVWNKAGNGGAGCWQEVNDFVRPCLVLGTSPAQRLSTGVVIGFAGLGAPPPNTQAGPIQQAPLCENTNGAGTIANTACIVFNSRGYPINSPGNQAPTGNDAFYITDNTMVYAVTVGLTGVTQVWATGVGGAAGGQTGGWFHK